MNIVEYIGENIEHFSFKYFGINDMFTGWDLETLINKNYDVLCYYQKRSRTIDTFDDFIDYLFVYKYSHFLDTIPYVKEDKKQEVEAILNSMVKIKNEYPVEKVIKYCKKGYKFILSQKGGIIRCFVRYNYSISQCLYRNN